jgi:hypothetical protein
MPAFGPKRTRRSATAAAAFGGKADAPVDYANIVDQALLTRSAINLMRGAMIGRIGEWGAIGECELQRQDWYSPLQ